MDKMKTALWGDSPRLVSPRGEQQAALNHDRLSKHVLVVEHDAIVWHNLLIALVRIARPTCRYLQIALSLTQKA